MYRIYLAGPITGCSYQEATDWRDEFERCLRDAADDHALDVSQIQCLSPMRGKTYLAAESSIALDYPGHILSNSRAIMARDCYDVHRSNLVVGNFLKATAVSIGTCMEAAWAFRASIPLIGIIEPAGNLHEHPMIREALAFRTESIEQAAHVALMTLWPK